MIVRCVVEILNSKNLDNDGSTNSTQVNMGV